MVIKFIIILSELNEMGNVYLISSGDLTNGHIREKLRHTYIAKYSLLSECLSAFLQIPDECEFSIKCISI